VWLFHGSFIDCELSRAHETAFLRRTIQNYGIFITTSLLRPAALLSFTHGCEIPAGFRNASRQHPPAAAATAADVIAVSMFFYPSSENIRIIG